MRKDARENRQEILAVARSLLAQYGNEVSMRTIAATAGVGIATLYRNFPSRVDLIFGIVEQIAGEVRGLVDDCLAAWDTDPESAWRNFVHAVAQLKMSALATQFAETSEMSEIAGRLRQLRSDSIGCVSEVLDCAQEAGLVAHDMSVEHFQVGLATITRPLPELPTIEGHPGQAWLVDVFLKGVRPD